MKRSIGNRVLGARVVALLAFVLLAALGAAAVAADLIGEAKAREIAVAHAGLSASEAEIVKFRQFERRGATFYEVVVVGKGARHKYEIDAATGDIVEYRRDAQGGAKGAQNKTGDYIGVDRAKEIAFAHAKVDASKVYRLHVDMDRDDGRMIYEVDFKHDGWEYDYEIDAVTGEILEWDRDRD